MASKCLARQFNSWFQFPLVSCSACLNGGNIAVLPGRDDKLLVDAGIPGSEEWVVSPAPNSLTQPEERSGSGSLREVTTLGRLTESIAKELNESLSGVVINAGTCLRMLAADPPNVEGARETVRRTIRDSNRAAAAVSRLHALLSETDKGIKTVAPSMEGSSMATPEGTR